LPGCGAYGQWEHWEFDIDPAGFKNCGSCRKKGDQYEMTQCLSDGKNYVLVTYSDKMCTKKVKDSGLISADPSGCGHKEQCKSYGPAGFSTGAYYYAIESKTALTISV